MDLGEVRTAARLARITLSEEECLLLGSQLKDILGHIQRIDRLDLEQTQPVSHPFNLTDVFREDTVHQPCDPAKILDIAPDRDRGMFRVPQVVEGTS